MKQPHTKPYKVPILMSYAHLRKLPEAGVQYFFENPHAEFLIDSGAFTALNIGETVTLEEYLAFLTKYKAYVKNYIALDVLGDPAGTDVNLRKMHAAGFRPIPVHVRNDNAERMDELFTQSDWVALGGLRRPQQGVCPQEFVELKMRMAKGRHVHWLGYANLAQLNHYKPFSCDATTPASMRRYGRLQLYIGNLLLVDRRKEDLKRNKTQSIINIIEESGFTWEDLHIVDNWHGWNSVASQISFYSWIKMGQEYWQRNHTKIYLAIVPGVVRDIFFAIDKRFGTNYRKGITKCF